MLITVLPALSGAHGASQKQSAGLRGLHAGEEYACPRQGGRFQPYAFWRQSVAPAGSACISLLQKIDYQEDPACSLLRE